MFMKMSELKRCIQFLSPKTQILEVESMINLSNKSNLRCYTINKIFRMLKELHTLRKELIKQNN